MSLAGCQAKVNPKFNPGEGSATCYLPFEYLVRLTTQQLSSTTAMMSVQFSQL
jgi:hypothetical protein